MGPNYSCFTINGKRINKVSLFNPKFWVNNRKPTSFWRQLINQQTYYYLLISVNCKAQFLLKQFSSISNQILSIVTTVRRSFSLKSFLTRFSPISRHSHDNISDAELERVLRERGSDYETMVNIHKRQKAFEETVAKSLREMGHQVEMASR